MIAVSINVRPHKKPNVIIQTGTRTKSIVPIRIMNEMNSLQSLTSNMKTGMDEMALGAKKINETGITLSEISKDVQNAITNIGNQIDRFKTE